MSNCTAYINGKKVGEVKDFTPPIFGEREMKDIEIIPSPNFGDGLPPIDNDSAEILREDGVIVIDIEDYKVFPFSLIALPQFT